MTRLCLLIALILCGSERAFAEDAGDTARIPYAAIRNVLTSNPVEASGHLSTHVQMVPHVRSKIEGVAPKQIELTLVLGDDRLPLKVSSDGSFQLPTDKKWNHETALILTNQPDGSLVIVIKGTMHLGRITAKRVGDSGIICFSHMFPSESIREKVHSTTSEAFPGSKAKFSIPQVEVVQFQHDTEASLKATILSADGESEIDVDSKGLFTMPRTKVRSGSSAQLRLTPANGWRWRAKRKGMPWETWVPVSMIEEEAEPCDATEPGLHGSTDGKSTDYEVRGLQVASATFLGNSFVT